MKQRTPDQIAQSFIDDKSAWCDGVDWGGRWHIDERAFRLALIRLIEKERKDAGRSPTA